MTNTTTPTVTVETTRYEVTGRGEDGVVVKITVERHRDGRWGITQDGVESMDAQGEWSFTPRSSDLDEEWLAAHRFDEDTARELAQKEAVRQVREA